tara:strand:+ start:406 stop:762 length:357 start_codon:yes stop_codon:yes gene_type:complete
MDKISIINLEIPARHGVYNFEKNKDEIFEIDIELFVNLSVPGKSDRLSDTINYGDVIAYVTDVFTKKDYNLIEAVGESICTALIKEYPVKKVCIRIRKPHAPINANFKTVEVELTRHI